MLNVYLKIMVSLFVTYIYLKKWLRKKECHLTKSLKTKKKKGWLKKVSQKPKKQKTRNEIIVICCKRLVLK